MAMALDQAFVLPGEQISSELIPAQPNSPIPLKLGPGLRHVPPLQIISTLSGILHVDSMKKAIWVEHNGGRVRPWSTL